MDDRWPIKTGVVQGGGPPPGYLWNVGILGFAFDEADEFLTLSAYRHLADQVKDLASLEEPTNDPPTVDVRRLVNESFRELRDRGGPLGKLNVRLFFGVDHASRALIELGVVTKQNNGPTPRGDLVRMRNRWRKYQAGEFGSPFRAVDDPPSVE